MQKTEAIIFDCFGVLTSDGWLPFKKKHFSRDVRLNQQATDLNRMVDSGLISYEDFIQGVASLAHMPIEEARRAIEDNVANERLFEYMAAELKPSYKLGLLSNAGADWLSELFTAAQVALFDAVSLSYETGFVKPDEHAYINICEKLGVESAGVVFVDDQERFCSAAEDAGMRSVWYQDFDQFQTELEKLL